MNAFLRDFLRPMLATMSVIPLIACAYSGGPVEGTVLEEGVGKPIPDATVVVRWEGTAFSFAHTQSVCIHVESAITDDKGHFRIPAWRASVQPAGVHDLKPLVTVHKPGYEEYRAPGYVRTEAFKQNIRYLKPFTGGREERLEYLSRAAVSCSHVKEIEIKLLPLYKALYEEANSIAVTKEEKIKALHHLKDIEKLELGSTKAWENFHRREKDLK